MIEFATVEQGSEAWHALRLGIPTASCADRVLTPKKLEASSQQGPYLCEKLAERLLGITHEWGGDGPSTRGTQLEEQAARSYCFENGVAVRKSGFMVTDDRRVGASVDRVIVRHGRDVGLLEIKCPLAPRHLAMLLGHDRDAHRLQKQWQLWVSELEFVDLRSEFPGLPAYEDRFTRDEECIAAIAHHANAFAELIDIEERRVRKMMGEAVAA